MRMCIGPNIFGVSVHAAHPEGKGKCLLYAYIHRDFGTSDVYRFSVYLFIFIFAIFHVGTKVRFKVTQKKLRSNRIVQLNATD